MLRPMRGDCSTQPPNTCAEGAENPKDQTTLEPFPTSGDVGHHRHGSQFRYHPTTSLRAAPQSAVFASYEYLRPGNVPWSRIRRKLETLATDDKATSATRRI